MSAVMQIEQIIPAGYRNDAFVPEKWIEKIHQALRDAAAKVSRDGFALSATDFESLDKAKALAVGAVEEYFAFLKEQADFRVANLLKYGKKISAVSMGEDCFSRSLLARWGFKASAKLGEKSHPFDLSVHPLESTTQLLRTNFENYLDSANLYYSEKDKYVHNRLLKVSFNHEVGEDYAKNDFEKIKTTYARRIEQFFYDVDRATKVLFFVHVRDPHQDRSQQMSDLNSVLKDRWGERVIPIFFCTYPAGFLSQNEAVTEQTNGLCRININYPFKNYVWHSNDHMFCPAGHAFERQVAQALDKILEGYVSG